MAKKKQQINNIALVVDASASMSRFSTRVRQVFSNLINDIKGNTAQTNHVSVVLFNDQITNIPADSFSDRYSVRGNTRLYDAVGEAIEQLRAKPTKTTKGVLPWEKSADVANLVIVLTDGEENQSRNYTHANLRGLIKELQDNGDWTFVFQVPPGHRRVPASLDIPMENIREWEATEQGFTETMGATRMSLTSYYDSRSSGMRSVSNFYKGQTDLSGVTAKDLKSLENVTDRFRTLPVKAESVIQEFVESTTGKTYLPGTAYYQLTKPEIIQSRKGVLIVEKGKKTILGGPKARDLVGLKPFKDGKITPGNHSDFDIFVQSTSSNRKLVRGTKLLVVK